MPTRTRKPQEGGTPEKVIPPLGWLFLACAIALFILAFQVPWFGQYCIFFGECSLVLALGCFGYWVYLHSDEIKLIGVTNSKNLDLSVIYSPKMKAFLYQSNATAPDPYDPRYQQVPKVRKTKDGLRIETIGKLRQWLISDQFRDSLEAFLNSQGNNVSVQNAQYHPDGWVYYRLVKGIKSDRLRF